MGHKLKVGTKIMSKWQYGKDGYPRFGTLPEGWDGDGTVLIQWDDDSSEEWDDRTSFIVTPPLKEVMRILA